MKYRPSLAPLVTILTLLGACHEDGRPSTPKAPDAASPVSDGSRPEAELDAQVSVPDASIPDAAPATIVDAQVPSADAAVGARAPWMLTFDREYPPALLSVGDELWSVSETSRKWEITVRRMVAGRVEESWKIPGGWGHIVTDGEAVFVLAAVYGVVDVLGETVGEADKESLVIMRMQAGPTPAWRHVFVGNPSVHPKGFVADRRGHVFFGYLSGDISTNHNDEWSHGLVELDAQSGAATDALTLPDLRTLLVQSDGTLIISGMLLPGEDFADHKVEGEDLETFVASLLPDSHAVGFAVFWPSYRSALTGLHEDDLIVGASDDDVYSLTRLSGVDGTLRWRYHFPMSKGGSHSYTLLSDIQGDLQMFGHHEQELRFSDSLALEARDSARHLFVASFDGATGKPNSALAIPGAATELHGTMLTLPGEACPLASGSYTSTLTIGGLTLPEVYDMAGFIVTLCSP